MCEDRVISLSGTKQIKNLEFPKQIGKLQIRYAYVYQYLYCARNTIALTLQRTHSFTEILTKIHFLPYFTIIMSTQTI